MGQWVMGQMGQQIYVNESRGSQISNVKPLDT